MSRDNCVIEDMSNEEYHASAGTSKTNLDWINSSPAHFKYFMENRPKPTPAMAFGSAAHTACLEREKIEDHIAVLPEINKRTNAGKDKYAEFVFENRNKTIVTIEEFDRIRRIADKVNSIKLFKNIMDGAKTEVSCFVDIDGVLRKSRADIFRTDGILADLKTCQKASLSEVQKSVYNYRYHVQSPYYLDNFSEATGKKYDQFIFIFVEKEEPHGVAFYAASKKMIERGRLDYQQNIETLKQCMKTDTWPDYEEKILEISLPKWA